MRWNPGGNACNRSGGINSSALQRHLLAAFLPGTAIVLVTEMPPGRHRTTAAADWKWPPVRVPAEIFQNMVRSAEGRLGVDHPFQAGQRLEPFLESVSIRQRSSGP